MSHVHATPQQMADAAGNLSAIGSTINTANATAATGTAGVQAPGGDAVSAYITALFAAHAQNYQVAGAQAAHLHDQFVQTLRAGAGSYANTEVANASPLDKASGVVSTPSQNSAGHLIGNGANGAMGTGQHGNAGGPWHANGDTSGPGSGNLADGGPGASGPAGPAAAPGPAGAPTAGGHAAAAGGPQGADAGGGGAHGVPAGDGGGSAGPPSGTGSAPGGSGSAPGGSGGAPSGSAGGGGGGGAADPGGAGGGFSGVHARDAAGFGVPAAVAPPMSVAPIAPLLPGLAAPTAPAVMAGEYSATAGLGGAAVSGESPALGPSGEPAAPAASPATATPGAAAPAAEKALATATKEQSAHQSTPARAGEATQPADSHHDKAVLPIALPSLKGLREKLQQRSGLRNIRDWRKELNEPPVSEPWGRDELLSVLGLRPPGSE